MLTPVDIENKEFTKAFRGYDIYEVEEFMKSLVADYEKLYRENGELKEKAALLNDAIANYKGMEETMQNAILVAQRTAEDIKQNAYERSETIIKDAERRAAEAIDQANRSIGQLEKTYLSMQREVNGFKAKMTALLSTYMQLLQELPEQSIVPNMPTAAVSITPPAERPEAAPRAADVPADKPEPAMAAEAPLQPEREESQEDTNPFSLPSAGPEKPEEAEPAAEPAAAEPDAAAFASDRKLNPVVEELLRKKREEARLKTEEPAPEQPSPSFSVTKETIQKESSSHMSEINVEDLKAYDVFADDTI